MPGNSFSRIAPVDITTTERSTPPDVVDPKLAAALRLWRHRGVRVISLDFHRSNCPRNDGAAAHATPEVRTGQTLNQFLSTEYKTGGTFDLANKIICEHGAFR